MTTIPSPATSYAAGELDRAGRNELPAEMTGEVARLALADNRAQNTEPGLARTCAPEMHQARPQGGDPAHDLPDRPEFAGHVADPFPPVLVERFLLSLLRERDAEAAGTRADRGGRRPLLRTVQPGRSALTSGRQTRATSR
ncbi:hypothetical protein [Pseudonocardia kunmingensis]|uniref:hypothetical protein n=1 Tax=Pseudonocardia kunmingensis TaxID=630975 RepID=UPI001478D6F1|nr:hypothetical protein [Pseudonocardia kunmingensis]